MSKPLIVAIDDAEGEVKPLVSDDLELTVFHPDDEELPDKLSETIGAASLILLDQKFNDEKNPLSLRAADGASFVGHLRSWSRQNAQALPPIVLLTNESEAFKNEVPSVGASLPLSGSFVGREFQIAPALDVEWIQHKSEDSTANRIWYLAKAVVTAREAIEDDGVSLEDLAGFLCLSADQVWTERAKEELRGARPPVSQKDGSGQEPCGPTQVIRWMCHRALPFPGMFLSDLYAAWALGMTVEAFQKMAEIATAKEKPEAPWLKELDAAEYGGPLWHFQGRRWWKSGIDHLVWKLDLEASKQKDRTKAFASLAPNVEIGTLSSASAHVVTWTPELLEGEISSIDEAVQLHPPGWPVEALDPWIRVADTENDAVLKAMIETADLPKE